jgi:fatty-acyl-CoA synthase
MKAPMRSISDFVCSEYSKFITLPLSDRPWSARAYTKVSVHIRLFVIGWGALTCRQRRRNAVRGMMMDVPLLTHSLVRHAARYHADTEIVSRTVEGPVHRYTYAEAYARIQQLANALVGMGVGPGDRVATMAWSGYRHFELYYAIGGIGAVCHTINPRLFADQIEYIVGHAGDRFIFADLGFIDVAEGLADRLTGVEGYVVMTDAGHMPETALPNARCYETLIAGEAADFEWPVFDENTAAALCYTSGTTGNPKGVLYSHRAIMLHAFSTCQADHPLALSSQATILPAVPMFHVHAWGAPYGAPMCGAKIVFPGPGMDGESLYALLEDEQVTLTAGVPTVWLGLLEYMEKTGKRLNHLQVMNIGGSAPPLSMIKAFEEDYGVPVVHAWGMTEMSPVGTSGTLKRKFRDLPRDERYKLIRKQGRPLFGVEMTIVDDDGNTLPHDGEATGELRVRGPWVAAQYFNDPEASAAAFDDEGWFGTGDVASIDADGHVQITDRNKDLIKSRGEWISSIELENAAMAHPGIAEAAAIAVAHPKHGERPLLIVVRRDGAEITLDDIRDVLAGKVPTWWAPDDVVFVDDLPHTGTGKINKRALRRIFADYTLPTA